MSRKVHVTVNAVFQPDGTIQVTMEFFLGSCTFCGHCTDFCTRKCLRQTEDYDMVARSDNDLKQIGRAHV